MHLSRRHFLLLAGSTTATAALDGCRIMPTHEQSVDALGPDPVDDAHEALCLFVNARVPSAHRLPRRFGAREVQDGFLPLNHFVHAADDSRSIVIRVQRPADLLDLQFELSNASFVRLGGKTRLRIIDLNTPAYLTVHFPPQHVLEGFGEEGNPVHLPMKADLCGPSRLVFQIPPAAEDPEKSFSFDDLMVWTKFWPIVPGCALPPGQGYDPTVILPGYVKRRETAIELPWGLLLAPHAGEHWEHAVAPRVGRVRRMKSVRTELWHTNLTVAKDDKSLPSVRAVDLTSYDPSDPELRPLPSASDRQKIIAQTTNFRISEKYVPPAIEASRLSLSMLGGYAKLDVGWDQRTLEQLSFDPCAEKPRMIHVDGCHDVTMDLAKWSHQTIWGRDQYIDVERLFYGMPFGHPILLVIIRNRELHKTDNGGAGTEAAALIQRVYCEVLNDTMEYSQPAPPGVDRVGLRNCFQRVVISPKITPLLEKPNEKHVGALFREIKPKNDDANNDKPKIKELMAAWMYLYNDPSKVFEFDIEATDWQGTAHHFKLPLYAVAKDVGLVAPNYQDPFKDFFQKAVDQYASQPQRRTAKLSGQKIAYVPPLFTGNQTPRDSSVPTNELLFALEERTNARREVGPPPEWIDKPEWSDKKEGNFPRGDKPFVDWLLAFYPAVARAQVSLHSAAAFAAKDPGDKTYICWSKEFYLNENLPRIETADAPNRRELYADVFGAELNFNGTNSGGLCTPSIAITALSRKLGLWSDKKPEKSATTTAGASAGASAIAPAEANADVDFDPKRFFAGLGKVDGKVANLIGGVPLTSVIQEVKNVVDDISRVPKLIATEMRQWRTALNTVEARVVEVIDELKKAINADAVKELREQLEAELNAQLKRVKDAVDALLDRVQKESSSYVHTLVEALEGKAWGSLEATLNGLSPERLQQLHDQVTAAMADADVRSALSLIWPAKATLEDERTQLKDLIAGKLRQVIEKELVERQAAFARVIAQKIDEHKDDIEKIKTAVKDELKRLFKPELGSVTQLEQELLNIVEKFHDQPELMLNTLVSTLKVKLADVVEQYLQKAMAKVRQDVDGPDFEKQLSHSLVQLRDRILAKVAGIGPDADFDQAQLEEWDRQFRELRGEFDRGIEGLVGPINDISQEFKDRVAELERFPLPQIQEVLDRIERCKKALTDPATLRDPGRLFDDLKDMLGALRRLILGLAGAANAGRSESQSGGKVTLDHLVNFETKRLHRAAKQFVEFIDSSNAKIQALLGRLCGDIGNKLNVFKNAKIKELKTEVEKIICDSLDLDSFIKTFEKKLVGDDPLQESIDKIVKAIDEIVKAAVARLTEVFEAANEIVVTALNRVSALIDEIVDAVLDAVQAVPTELNLEYLWQPRLKDALIFVAGSSEGPAAFTLTAKVRKKLLPAELTNPPSVTIEGLLEKFKLMLIPGAPFLTVEFRKVHFISIDGRKPEVDVDILSVKFGAALAFVQEIAAKLGAKSGYFIESESSGVLAGYRYTLPNLTVGALTIAGVSITTAVQLPFNGDPVRVRFSLAERHRPFQLSVGVFAGFGFFAITLSPRGIERLEGSLEFGAAIALDIGVASGRASVSAGIYFSGGRDDRDDRDDHNISYSSLFGFVRATGSLRILGLITLTVEFYLGLGYERRGNRSYAVGEAVVHVEIDMTFFSIGVDLHYRKEFEGSPDRSSGSGGESEQLALAEDPIDQDACDAWREFQEEWKAREAHLIAS